MVGGVWSEQPDTLHGKMHIGTQVDKLRHQECKADKETVTYSLFMRYFRLHEVKVPVT